MAWTRSLLVQKAKALTAHLSISAVLVGTAFFLMLTRWFPAPLFHTDGGGTGPKLLVMADLILGPLLTFVVFNPAKPRRLMAFDLGTIAVAQLVAFAYGIHSIHEVRIATVAWYEGQFQAVSASTFKNQKITAADWQRLGTGEPYLVDVHKPATAEEINGVTAYGLMSGLSPFQLHFLYDPFAATARKHWAEGWSLSELQAKQPTLAGTAGQWLRRHDQTAEQVRFYRVTGFYDNAVMALDAEGHWLGGFAGQLPVKPPSTSAPISASAKPTS